MLVGVPFEHVTPWTTWQPSSCWYWDMQVLDMSVVLHALMHAVLLWPTQPATSAAKQWPAHGSKAERHCVKPAMSWHVFEIPGVPPLQLTPFCVSQSSSS